jgi:hypothetical protein
LVLERSPRPPHAKPPSRWRPGLSGEPHLQGSHILLQVAAAFCAWDRHDVVALGQQPGNRELASSRPLLVGQPLQLCHHSQVAGKVLALEAGKVAAQVVRREVVGAGELPGQQAAAERGEGDEADVQLADGGQQLALGVAVNSEYSLCRAVTGWTALARRIVAGAASEIPR